LLRTPKASGDLSRFYELGGKPPDTLSRIRRRDRPLLKFGARGGGPAPLGPDDDVGSTLSLRDFISESGVDIVRYDRPQVGVHRRFFAQKKMRLPAQVTLVDPQ
jgi:hypothetical protein